MPGGDGAGFCLVVGSGDCAQLGLGYEGPRERKFPAIVKSIADRTDIVDISAGGLHNLILTSSGEVLSWGCNDDKALGREGDEYTPSKIDYQITDQDDVPVQIVAGASHSALRTEDGRVYTWGTYKDVTGKLGYTKTQKSQPRPAIVTFLRDYHVVKIAAGEQHIVALTDSGLVFEWGDTRIGRRQSSRLKKEKLRPRQVRFPRNVRIVNIFVTVYTNFAIDCIGKVFAWGLNNYGQIGNDSNDNILTPGRVTGLECLGSDIVDIQGGEQHTLFLTEDHKVFSCGNGNYGRLGHGDEKERLTPCHISSLPVDIKDYVVAISAGDAHSLAVTSSGDLYTWGYGDVLQLGNGDYQDEHSPRKVQGKQIATLNRHVIKASGGSQHSVILVKDRS